MRTLKRNFYFSLRQITFPARACTGKTEGKIFNAVRPVHPVDINESRGYAAGQITRLIVDTKFYLCLSVKIVTDSPLLCATANGYRSRCKIS